MGHYIVVKIMDQDSDVLWSKLSSKHLAVPECDRFLDIAVKFQERRNFPNVIGCIDGKRILVKYPTNLDHCFTITNFFSTVLQVVADSESWFIFIDTGAYGSQSDGGTFPLLLYITSWKTLNLP
jgi:hypothetical protein